MSYFDHEGRLVEVSPAGAPYGGPGKGPMQFLGYVIDPRMPALGQLGMTCPQWMANHDPAARARIVQLSLRVSESEARTIRDSIDAFCFANPTYDRYRNNPYNPYLSKSFDPTWGGPSDGGLTRNGQIGLPLSAAQYLHSLQLTCEQWLALSRSSQLNYVLNRIVRGNSTVSVEMLDQRQGARILQQITDYCLQQGVQQVQQAVARSTVPTAQKYTAASVPVAYSPKPGGQVNADPCQVFGPSGEDMGNDSQCLLFSALHSSDVTSACQRWAQMTYAQRLDAIASRYSNAPFVVGGWRERIIGEVSQVDAFCSRAALNLAKYGPVIYATPKYNAPSPAKYAPKPGGEIAPAGCGCGGAVAPVATGGVYPWQGALRRR